MAIKSVRVHRAGAKGKQEATKRDYEIVYLVETTYFADGPAMIMAYFLGAGLPNPTTAQFYFNPLSSDEYDLAAFCNGLSCERSETLFTLWKVTATFSSQTGGKDKNQPDEDGNHTTNPIDFRPQISINNITVQRPVTSAIYRGGFTGGQAARFDDGSSYVPQTSAMTVYDPPLEREVAQELITVSKNVIDWDGDAAQAVVGFCNSNPMTLVTMSSIGYSCTLTRTWAAYTLRVKDYKVAFHRENVTYGGVQATIDYMKVSCEVLWDPDGWRSRVADRDFVRITEPGAPDGKGGTYSSGTNVAGVPNTSTIKDKQGHSMTKPPLLDGNGQPLKAGVDGKYTPVIITWQTYGEGSMNIFPLIGSILTYTP